MSSFTVISREKKQKIIGDLKDLVIPGETDYECHFKHKF